MRKTVFEQETTPQSTERIQLEIFSGTNKSVPFFNNNWKCQGDYFKDITSLSDHFEAYIQPYYYITNSPNLRSMLSPRNRFPKSKISFKMPKRSKIGLKQNNNFKSNEEDFDWSYNLMTINFENFGDIKIEVSCLALKLDSISYSSDKDILLLKISLAKLEIDCQKVMGLVKMRHFIIIGSDNITLIQIEDGTYINDILIRTLAKNDVHWPLNDVIANQNTFFWQEYKVDQYNYLIKVM